MAPTDLAVAADWTLVQAHQQGHEDAFAEIYRRYCPSIRAVCRARFSEPDLAEEAVQETFVRAIQGLCTFDNRMPIVHWLRRIARNLCIDARRRRWREVAMGSPGLHNLQPIDPSGESEIARADARCVLDGVLCHLSERDRSLLFDHHALGHSIEALAKKWGITGGAMAVALDRARSRARQHAS